MEAVLLMWTSGPLTGYVWQLPLSTGDVTVSLPESVFVVAVVAASTVKVGGATVHAGDTAPAGTYVVRL